MGVMHFERQFQVCVTVATLEEREEKGRHEHYSLDTSFQLELAPQSSNNQFNSIFGMFRLQICRATDRTVGDIFLEVCGKAVVRAIKLSLVCTPLQRLFHSFTVTAPCRKQSANLQTEDVKQHRSFQLKAYLPLKFTNKDKLPANSIATCSSHWINTQQKPTIHQICSIPTCCFAQIRNAPCGLCPMILLSTWNKIQKLTLFITKLDYNFVLNFKTGRETQVRVQLQGSNVTNCLLVTFLSLTNYLK